MSNAPKLLTISQARRALAERGLAVTDETLRRWAQDGKIRAHRLPSGQYRFPADALDGVLSPAADGAVA